jgi:hypothetical protein
MAYEYGIQRPGEFLTGNIEYFTCYTLVDITDTGIYDPTSGKPYEQAQNLNSLMQAISLSSQPILSSVEKLLAVDLSTYNFGSNFTGAQTVWILRFATEHVGAVTIPKLKINIEGIPVYNDLDETAVFDSEIFETTSSTNCNIYFNEHEYL